MTVTSMSVDDVNRLIERLERAASLDQPLDRSDVSRLLEITKAYFHLQERLEAGDLTIHRLRKLLGMVSASEKRRDLMRQRGMAPTLGETASSMQEMETESDELVPHGRRGVQDFEDAAVEHHILSSFARGDFCTECHSGRFYKYEPAQFVRISGYAPLQATVHVIEQLRCNGCGRVVRANLPDHVVADGASGQRFGYSAMALIALLRYAAGMPLFRQQELQKMLKVPIAASTLWDQCESVGNALAPIYKALKKEAAAAHVFYADDTGNKIISQQPELRKRRGTEIEVERTGVHTSGIVAELANGREVVLFKTGINHAGEFMDEILSARSIDADEYVYMSDGLSANATTIRNGVVARCNVHARRQFADIVLQYPEQCRRVIDCYEQVYAVEAEAVKKALSPAERLSLHQKRSLPLMEDMFDWAADLLETRQAEPNSSLGKALRYLGRHRQQLLVFTERAGAPLDNNRQEEKLKRVVLHRKNSLFFKEPIGAEIADIIMSVCATASSTGINVHQYLIHLLQNASAVRRDPLAFLPWTVSRSFS